MKKILIIFIIILCGCTSKKELFISGVEEILYKVDNMYIEENNTYDIQKDLNIFGNFSGTIIKKNNYYILTIKNKDYYIENENSNTYIKNIKKLNN